MIPMNVNNSAASLYVDDLHPDVTEAMLFEKFCKVGPILSIRVCRDTVTRRSLGYGYVNFHQAADAERALDTLDLDAIKGKPMHISFQKDPSFRRSGLGKVFVKNLDKAIDNKAIYESFSAFGTILACKVAVDENGESCGYGFVRFETEEAAQSAIQKVNNMQLNGRHVIVEKFVPRKERSSGTGDQALNFTNVYIKNFPIEWSEDDFYRVCQAYGKISSLKIMTDTEGISKGFGFVSFESHQAAQQCVDELNGKECMGRQIFAGRAQTKSERSTVVTTRPETGSRFQGVNLYIKNLDDEIDDDRLKKEFAQFGTITSAKVMRHESGMSRGFGFVCFTTQEAANNAVMQMNNQVISTKPLYVALHQSKEVRQAQLASQRMNLGYHPGQVFQGPAFNTYYQTIPQQGAVPSQVAIQPQATITQQGTIQPQAAIQSQAALPLQGTIQTQGNLPTQGAIQSQAAIPLQGTIQTRGTLPAQRAIQSQAAIPIQGTIQTQGTLPTQRAIPTQGGLLSNSAIHTQVSVGSQGTLQGAHGQHSTHPSGPVVHQTRATVPGHVSQPTHTTYPSHVTHPTYITHPAHVTHPAHTSIQTTLPGSHLPGSLPPQGNVYPIQFAAQVHHPRWPTAQIHPVSQAGYHVMPGLAAHQYGAMNHITATVPRSIPVPGGLPPGHVTDESQRPLI